MIENLKLLRRQRAISQKQLAEIVGVSQQSINKYENHAIEPDIHTLKKLADYFGTSIDYLVGFRSADDEDNALHLSEAEAEMVREFRRLSERKKASVVEIIHNYNEK